MKRTAAFTLIDLVIALAIGLLLMALLFSTVRTTTTAIKLAGRMSKENQLLRQGIHAVLDEADLWTGIDDPFASSPDIDGGQGLRWWLSGTAAPGYGGDRPAVAEGRYGYDQRSGGNLPHFNGSLVGLPFAWLQVTRAVAEAGGPDLLDLNINPAMPVPPNNPARENDLGWNPAYHWSAADERTWFQGYELDGRNHEGGNDPGKRLHADRRFGRYALFSNVSSAATLGLQGLSFTAPGHFNAADDTGEFGNSAPLHRWRDNQLLGLRLALGQFGVLSYVPANAILLTYGASYGPGAYLPEAIPATWTPNTQGTRSTSGNGFSASIDSAFSIEPRSTWTRDNPGATGQRYGSNDRSWIWVNHTRDLQNFGLVQGNVNPLQHLAKILPRRTLNLQRPSDSSELIAGVGRMYSAGRFLSIASVQWTSPVTGEVQRLIFPVSGTTLRGARQQRRPNALGGGWARWYGYADPRNDPNLDSVLKPSFIWNPTSPDANPAHYTSPP